MSDRRQSGQAMVEFALILPLLLLVVLMGLQALVLMTEHAVTQRCAGELARYGATLGGTAGTVAASIDGYAQSVDVCATETGGPVVVVAFGDWPPGHTVTVTVTRAVPITTPLVAAFWPDGQFTATVQAQAWGEGELTE